MAFGEDDHLNRTPTTGRFKQLAAGVVAPVCIVLLSVYSLVTGITPIFAKKTSGTVTGTGGVIVALSYLAGAAYMHFRYYWDWSERLEPHSHWPKFLSLVFFISGLVFGLIHAFLHDGA
jgi:drug/metabolite transporter (DMT)-like permease